LIVENLDFNIRRTGDDAARGMESLNGSLKKLKRSSDNTVSGLSKLVAALKRIAMYRVLRTIIAEIGKALSEGLKNVYAFSEAVGGTLSQSFDRLKSTSVQLTNSIGSAFAELLITVEPVLTAIMNLVIRVADAIARLFAVLGGRSTYTKAVESAEKWKDAAKGGAAAAKEWKNQLMGFDVINRLEDQSGSGGGGGGSAPYAGMMEEAPAIMEWAKQLRELTTNWWSQVDFKPLITAWERLKTVVGDFISLVDKGLYWAYTNVLLPLAQWHIEEGLPAAITFLASAFNLLNVVLEKLAPVFETLWEGLLKPFATWVGEKFTEILTDLTETFDSLAKKIEEADSLGDFLDSLDGKEKMFAYLGIGILGAATALALFNTVGLAFKIVSKVIGEGVGFITSPFGKLAIIIALVAALAKHLYDRFDFVKEAFDEFGEKLSEFKERAGDPAYWGELATSLVKAIATGIGAAIGELGRSIWELIKYLFAPTGEETDEISEAGNNAMLGFLQGVLNGIANIGKWIYNNVWVPFRDAVKAAFGIASPSKNMMEFGEYTIDGFLQGILDAFAAIGEWVDTNIWQPLKNALALFFSPSEAVQRLKGFGSNIVNGVKNGIITGMSGFGKWIGDTIWNPLAQGLNSITERINEWWQGITSFFSGANQAINKVISKADKRAADMAADGSVYLTGFASGGYPENGQLFIAREQGSELVGRIGNRNAVMNNDQIVDSVSGGVQKANEGVVNAILSSTIQVVQAIHESGGGSDIDWDNVARQVSRRQNWSTIANNA
jgi:phage-related protein